MPASPVLGFIGAGNMAEAIARAALEHGVLKADQIIGCDLSTERRAVFASLGIDMHDQIAPVLAAPQVLLAVKPQGFAALADALTQLTANHVVISIMAGWTTARMQQVLDDARKARGMDPLAMRLVRVMPNTPMLVGLGMAGLCTGSAAKAGDQDLALRLFCAGASEAVEIDEARMDALTAVSGSGPAYLFFLAEAMGQAAIDLGLADHADMLVRQTLLGAATLLAESPEAASELRRRVSSPGGTTEAAIRSMQADGVDAAIVRAIDAAAKRSRELGG